MRHTVRWCIVPVISYPSPVEEPIFQLEPDGTAHRFGTELVLQTLMVSSTLRTPSTKTFASVPSYVIVTSAAPTAGVPE